MNRTKVSVKHDFFLLKLPRSPKLPSQWYSNAPGNLGSLDNNKEIQSKSEERSINVSCTGL